MVSNAILKAIDRNAENQRRWLKINNRGLGRVPEQLCSLRHLTKLDLWLNKLSHLPECFSKLELLEQLDLSGNDFAEIPAPIFELTNLQVLTMPDNIVSEVPVEIARLKDLKTLWLGGPIGSISPALGSLSKLEDLQIRSSNSLPCELGELTNLRRLDLSGCQLDKFPEWILRLEKLESLRLWACGLTVVPDEIGELTNLDYLDLSENELTAIPGSILEMQSLRGLGLYDNPCLPILATPRRSSSNLEELGQGTLRESDSVSEPWSGNR